MNFWHDYLITEIFPAVKGDLFWEEYLVKAISDESSPVGIHLAVFVDPYLSYILQGKKTIESRFGIKRIPPYGKVAAGDILLLKRSGGPILGISLVTDVWFYCLNVESLNKIKREFMEALCAQDPLFWEERSQAAFATLMRVSTVLSIEPIKFKKLDRRGWVVLRPPLKADSIYL